MSVVRLGAARRVCPAAISCWTSHPTCILPQLPPHIVPVTIRLPNRSRFHDYFVTHLPSASLNSDSRSKAPHQQLPHDQSTVHDSPSGGGNASRSPSTYQQAGKSSTNHSRETTIVRIPLSKAKQHFGAVCARGTRPYNEDTYQAGTIEVPAFAKKAPMSLTSSQGTDQADTGKKGSGKDGDKGGDSTGTSAESASGDPQVFYFGVFDGHGGDQCSHFLRDKLHQYLEGSASSFQMHSSLLDSSGKRRNEVDREEGMENDHTPGSRPKQTDGGVSEQGAEELIKDVVRSWKDTVGGYFRRFKPEFFPQSSGGRGEILVPSVIGDARLEPDTNAVSEATSDPPNESTIEQVLTYTYLRADLDFVNQQVQASATDAPQSPSPTTPDATLDDDELGRHVHHSDAPFLGGSTSSIVLISTPTPTPFWHPSTPLSLITAHLGDTRILLCPSASGTAVPLTSNHHPDTPTEAARLRRYAAAFTTDSFGEERFAAGLANTRAFGDVRSKRMGVSAEPEIKLLHLRPAECSFLVLTSDGVAGVLSDQEVVDVVKEARTPEEGAKAVASLAEELAVGEKGDSDNATCLVVRLGGWERRAEGGGGSLGTKEGREWRRKEAADPRRGRT